MCDNSAVIIAKIDIKKGQKALNGKRRKLKSYTNRIKNDADKMIKRKKEE